MKTKIILVISFLVFMIAPPVQAVGDWDIYFDAVIEEGDIFSNVGVYDTPPDHTTVNMYGGSIDSLGIYDESLINISGGGVSTLYTHESSTAYISNGNVNHINILNNSVVLFSDNADSFTIEACDSGTLNMNGGVADHLGAIEFGLINIRMGEITNRLYAINDSIVNIYGYDLIKTNSEGSYGYGQVTGYWFDNTPFTINLDFEETYTHINLIPEPASLILLGLGILIIKRRK